MIKIDLGSISQIILSGIFDKELDKQIRINILESVPEKHYDMACDVFHDVREVYFDMGFIDSSYNEEKDNQARKNVLEDVHLKYRDTASEVFEATRVAYFDLGLDARKTLRHE